MALSYLAANQRHATTKTFLACRPSRLSHGVRLRTRCEQGNEEFKYTLAQSAACSAGRNFDPPKKQRLKKMLQYWNRVRWWMYSALAAAFVVMVAQHTLFAPAMSQTAAMAPQVASVTSTASMTVVSNPSEQLSRWLLYKMQRVWATLFMSILYKPAWHSFAHLNVYMIHA